MDMQLHMTYSHRRTNRQFRAEFFGYRSSQTGYGCCSYIVNDNDQIYANEPSP
jgi:hypothetical protein